MPTLLQSSEAEVSRDGQLRERKRLGEVKSVVCWRRTAAVPTQLPQYLARYLSAVTSRLLAFSPSSAFCLLSRFHCVPGFPRRNHRL